MFKKRSMHKLFFCIIAVIQSALLYAAALGWSGVLELSQELWAGAAALGVALMIVIIILGFGEFKPRRPKQPKPRKMPQPEYFVPPVPYPADPPPIPRVPGDTVNLFTEVSGGGARQNFDATEIVSQRRGLRLSWTVDGRPFGCDVFDFPVVIGRDPSCRIVIDAKSVSRRHAQLICDENGYALTDMGSSNGTKVGGMRVNSPIRVESGREIVLGQVPMRLEII